jgi:hypothetical protein
MTHHELQLFTKFYAVTGWILDRVEGYPKATRFTLADRTVNLALDVLQKIVQAQYARNKLDLLQGANEALQPLRILLRLAMEKKCLSFGQYEQVVTDLDECGRMLGGWIAQQARK